MFFLAATRLPAAAHPTGPGQPWVWDPPAGSEGSAPTWWTPPNPCTPEDPEKLLQLQPSGAALFALPAPPARLEAGDPAPLRSAPFRGRQVLPALHLPQHGRTPARATTTHYMYLNQGQQTIPNGLV